MPLLPEEHGRADGTSSRRAGSTRICSRSTCAGATPGGCCWPRCRRSSCSRCSWSTPVAPFILNARLKPLMLRTPERDKHIVNVSAVEGQFYRQLQDDAASAHQHGQGRAQHDDAHLGGGLPQRRHPHEQRRHRLGDRRGSRRDRGAQGRPSTASIRRSTSWTARRASSIRSSPASTPASTCGDSS